MRAGLPSGYEPAARDLRRPHPGYAPGPPYDIVVGDLFTVFPFGDVAVTFRITGETLWAALEHSVSRVTLTGGRYANTDGRFLQISGFRYRLDPRTPAGQRVVAVTLADGTPVPKDATEYTAVTGHFVYQGGDGFTMLDNGSGTTREVIADVVRQALERTGTVSVRTEGRITRVRVTSELRRY